MATSIQEPVWDTEYSEELNVPVPDLYPELLESLQNMQDSDTEQEEIAKGVINCSIICLSFIFLTMYRHLLFFASWKREVNEEK